MLAHLRDVGWAAGGRRRRPNALHCRLRLFGLDLAASDQVLARLALRALAWEPLLPEVSPTARV